MWLARKRRLVTGCCPKAATTSSLCPGGCSATDRWSVRQSVSRSDLVEIQKAIVADVRERLPPGRKGEVPGLEEDFVPRERPCIDSTQAPNPSDNDAISVPLLPGLLLRLLRPPGHAVEQIAQDRLEQTGELDAADTTTSFPDSPVTSNYFTLRNVTSQSVCLKIRRCCPRDETCLPHAVI